MCSSDLHKYWRSDALVEHRETSDRFQLLNGSWKFRYYASIYDLQDAFYEVGYDASAFDSIPVPSVWQNHGYDHHQYTNIRYPFQHEDRQMVGAVLQKLRYIELACGMGDLTSPTKRMPLPLAHF